MLMTLAGVLRWGMFFLPNMLEAQSDKSQGAWGQRPPKAHLPAQPSLCVIGWPMVLAGRLKTQTSPT